MTPIFKNYFLKNLYYTAVVLLFVIISINSDMLDLRRTVELINTEVTAISTNKAFYDDEENISYFSYAFDAHGINAKNITMESNEKGFIVPDLKASADNTASKIFDRTFGLGCMTAIIFGLYAFVYERKKTGINFIGALPYKKERIFLEKWLSGFICISVIMLVSFLLTGLWSGSMMTRIEALDRTLLIPQRIYPASSFGRESDNIGRMMWLIFIATQFMYAFVMLIQTLFGKPVYAALTAAALGIGLFGSVCSADIFFDSYNMTGLSGILHKSADKFEDFVLNTPLFTAAALAAIVLILLLGTACSKAARLERVGGVFMFAPVKYIVYLLLICEGALSFFGFVVNSCGFRHGSPANGAVYLIIGAIITLLGLNKLFSLEVEV